jgi:hypothetical protein
MTPSRSEEVIGRVLETMRGYSVRWDVHWAISKFRVLCFNTAPATRGWAYEGTPVQTTDQHKYLGVIHSTKKPFWHAHHTEKLAVACFLIVKLRAAGLMGGRNAPGAALEVVRSMVWQVLDYGRATAPTSTRGHSQIRKKLEALQLRVLREILGLSNSAPKLAVYGETGDLPDSWREKKKQMQIAFRMLNSDQSSIPYRVAREAHAASPKVGLFLRVSQILAEQEGEMKTIDEFKSKAEINRWISRAASGEWKRGVLLSSRIIDTYQVTSELRLRGYLRAEFRGRVILTKLRADDLELGAASFRGGGGSLVPVCQTCREQGCVESRAHFVLKCAALETVRRRHPDILKGIRSARPERAMATILLAFPRNAADDTTKAVAVGAYLHDLWSERARVLVTNGDARTE